MSPASENVVALLPEPVSQPLLLDDDTGATPADDLPPGILARMVQLSQELQAEEINLPLLLPLITEQAAHLMQCELAWIGLYDPIHREVQIVAAHGARQQSFEEMHVAFGEGIGGVALRRGMTLVVSDYRRYEHTTPAFVRDTIDREGIVSLMCAPMKRGDEFIGTLYTGNRHRTRFGPSHVSLLSMLAAQASVAIRNGRLYQTLRDRSESLEHTFAAHQRLHAAGADDGLNGVLGELVRITGRPLKLEQSEVPPFIQFAGWPEGEEPTGDDDDVAAAYPVVMSRRHVGRIVAYGSSELCEVDDNALTHGASVVALELMKVRAGQQVEWHLRGEMLEELIDVDAAPGERAVARAARLGLDLSAPHRLIVAQAPIVHEEHLSLLLGRLSGPRLGERSGVLAVQRAGQLIVAVIGDCDRSEGIAKMFLEETPSHIALAVGISSCRAEGFASSRTEATACAAFARQASQKSAIIDHTSLGPLVFMLDGHDVENAGALVRRCLGELELYDRDHPTDLLGTLRAFLEENGHHRSIAERCYVHPSTVKYRLGRISQILGRDMSDVNVRFELWLAVQLLDLFRLVDTDLLEPGSGRQTSPSAACQSRRAAEMTSPG